MHIYEIITNAKESYVYVNCNSKEKDVSLMVFTPYTDELRKIVIVTKKSENKVNAFEVLKEFSEKIQAHERAFYMLFPLTLKDDLENNYFYTDVKNFIVQSL